MTEEEESKFIPFKLVLVGESAVGKSSLVSRFVNGEFYEDVCSTIGAAFMSKEMTVGDLGMIKLEIWDTAGQERYKSLAPMYYRGASSALVVYDITSYDSFNRGKTWIKELKRQGSANIVIAMTGNKCDLSKRRAVETMEAQTYCEDHSILFFETSAKSGEGVEDVFMEVSKILLSSGERAREESDDDDSPKLKFGVCADGKCGICPRCGSNDKNKPCTKCQ